jgi:hypothetical protein
MVKSRGQHCGDIELVGYLANESDPVPLVLDLRVAHDRVGSSADPALNGHLRYPNNLEISLPRLQPYVLTSILMDQQSRLSLTLTFHTRKLLVF